MCRILKSGKIFGEIARTEYFLIRHSEPEKKLPGYLYIEPFRHLENYTEWTTQEFLDFGKALQKASAWIYSKYSPKKVYTVSIAEKVPHMHFHLVPRYEELKGPEYIRLALDGLLEPPAGIPFPNLETE
ncbi:HIT family protein [Leptospira perolatii]|uniref:HIT family protein n=1 Tax=Leptospira perolatii TaxID=2023191 RepID=UPI001FAEF284|nr:HIT domain-containing protein [Leptospira perolatii]